jgi:hypothetical protein
MPRSIVFSNVVLLLCVSALAGSGAILLVAAHGDVKLDMEILRWLAYVAVATAVVMVATEFLAGVRWPPVFALGATVVGLILMLGHDTVPRASACAWVAAWLGVVTWFTYLAARARENR